MVILFLDNQYQEGHAVLRNLLQPFRNILFPILAGEVIIEPHEGELE